MEPRSQHDPLRLLAANIVVRHLDVTKALPQGMPINENVAYHTYANIQHSGHLARHNRIHTGEKNFHCLYPGCPSRFSRQDNMMQHYRTHLSPRSRRNNHQQWMLLRNHPYSYQRHAPPPPQQQQHAPPLCTLPRDMSLVRNHRHTHDHHPTSSSVLLPQLRIDMSARQLDLSAFSKPQPLEPSSTSPPPTGPLSPASSLSSDASSPTATLPSPSIMMERASAGIFQFVSTVG